MNGLSSAWRSAAAISRMIKIEHSVFALPFAYLGAFLAARGWPGWPTALLLTVAMVAVRSYAMTVNRLADVDFDRLNPRTQARPLVTGEVGERAARLFAAGSAVVFVLTCAGMNSLVLALSPAALAISTLYSYSKRFTWLCHFILGATLGLAPLAGWLAVAPRLDLVPVLFGLGVLFWVAGFDIIYACQDVAFDRQTGLHSLPARLGLERALALAAFCHADTAIFFLLAGWAAGLSWLYLAVWAAIAGLLAWEHRLVRPDDLSRVNLAFFTLNGVVSILLFLGALADALVCG